jgi:DNA processing protein
VAIVGTRQATDYGKEIVANIVNELKPHHAMIVSGLAYGIDIHAHKQSLKNEMPTVAIMGSGMDVIYPAAHKETARHIVNHGALLTENHFGTQPDAHNFPARNRIIAGLCDALIVVEAAEKGGALITAEIANTYNKDVFAVPGSLGQVYSEGCNKLIRNNKAVIYTSIKDLEYHMNWSVEEATSETQRREEMDFSSFSADEQMILSLLKEKNNPVMIDELAIRSSISPSQLASILLTLEFSDMVRSLPGKLFALKKR